MSPSDLTQAVRRETPVLRADDALSAAVRALRDSGLPALPVVDAAEKLVGLFGEREFFGAIFPGYMEQIRYAGFVRRSLDDALEKRAGCKAEPVRKWMNTEHVDVPEDASDTQIAETFLHHRVLLLPVTADHRVVGAITRSDFFEALAGKFLSQT
ncbi:MAG: CBS domain-containing protein [Solirubrobacteraceae bacterium]|nr:CBS domain-containing protein [Solirubrobacteraceae bacterium]